MTECTVQRGPRVTTFAVTSDATLHSCPTFERNKWGGKRCFHGVNIPVASFTEDLARQHVASMREVDLFGDPGNPPPDKGLVRGQQGHQFRFLGALTDSLVVAILTNITPRYSSMARRLGPKMALSASDLLLRHV